MAIDRAGQRLRVAAIDPGKSRVGLAVADELGLYAHPRPFLDAKNRRAVLDALASLAREERIERFLVGLPLDQHGSEGLAARRAVELAQQIADATGVEVEMVDERFSTVKAGRELRDSGVSGKDARSRIDGVSAAVLLQGYLDARRDPRDDDEGEDEDEV